MSKNENSIVLKVGGRGMECIGTVRLTPEAEKVVRRLKAKTGLPIRQIVSDIIVQAENIITIVLVLPLIVAVPSFFFRL